MLLIAVQGMETSPRSSLLITSLGPSFFTMVPVMVSPLLSTTRSAAQRGRYRSSVSGKKRLIELLRSRDGSAAFVRLQVTLFVFLAAAAPAGVVAAGFGCGADGFVLVQGFESGAAEVVDGDRIFFGDIRGLVRHVLEY